MIPQISDDYQYDIFLSYTRRNQVSDWVQSHFYDLLKEHLDAALGRAPNIFIDKDIGIGEAWPLKLKQALAHSRCLIAVVSPAYFRSAWCLKECHIMLAREQAEGYRTLANTRGLVIPVIARNGEHHPEYMRDIQSVDLKHYVRVGGAFRNAPRYIEFEDEMEKWTKQVADAVRAAPIWRSGWPSEEDVVIPEIGSVQFNKKPQIM